MQSICVLLSRSVVRLSKNVNRTNNAPWSRVQYCQNAAEKEKSDPQTEQLTIQSKVSIIQDEAPPTHKVDMEKTPVAPQSGGYEYFKTMVKIVNVGEKSSELVEAEIVSHQTKKEALIGEDDALKTSSQTENQIFQADNNASGLSAEVLPSTESEGTLTKIMADDYILSSVKTKEDFLSLKTKLHPKLLKPRLQQQSVNLAAYVQESETLQGLVSLGVNLSEVDRDAEAASYLLKADFIQDLQPHVNLLLDNEVAKEDLGSVITKYPAVFFEDIDDIKVRINYLKSKKFTQTAIARIITKCPRVLGYATNDLDSKLGFIQREFKLNGDEVRQILTGNSKILLFNNTFIHLNRINLKDFCGFTDAEVKEMVVTMPKLILSEKRGVMERFNYVHDEIGLSHEDVVRWPFILRTRLFIMRQRHLFLKHLGRAQYDPTKENYVSLKRLVSHRDTQFCKNVAKAPLEEFTMFLKTL